MEPVAAADVDDAGGRGQALGDPSEAESFDRLSSPVAHSESLGREVEGVVARRVDALELGSDWPAIEVDERAATAAHHEELILRRSVLEVLSDCDRLCVIQIADRAKRRLHGERLSECLPHVSPPPA